ncbi:hypothetical protein E2C01_026631 [Portunus trituberculatus]|uniref:Uncharacterized protein n=1 Tax=Portunus trituberculatus TaxID=210409 RepID=A0A5B7EJA6_PORTR|nr:hypothetical protein [Portunus trituberculatus]
MQAAGFDLAIFLPHSTKSMSVSKATLLPPLSTILSTIGWSRESTSTKYYSRPITDADEFALGLGLAATSLSLVHVLLSSVLDSARSSPLVSPRSSVLVSSFPDERLPDTVMVADTTRRRLSRTSSSSSEVSSLKGNISEVRAERDLERRDEAVEDADRPGEGPGGSQLMSITSVISKVDSWLSASCEAMAAPPAGKTRPLTTILCVFKDLDLDAFMSLMSQLIEA